MSSLRSKDERLGIPRSERAKVFDPFYRVERCRNPGTGGVGLGLSVARSIIWEHGGDITLANRRGGGLSVRLELPVGLGVRPSEPGKTVIGQQTSNSNLEPTKSHNTMSH